MVAETKSRSRAVLIAAIVALTVAIVSFVIYKVFSGYIMKEKLVPLVKLTYPPSDDPNIYIPRILHQSHKSLDYVKNSFFLNLAHKSWTKHIDNPKIRLDYRFYDDAACRALIRDNFSADVLKAYDLMPIPVMRADLFRYCVLYVHGGVWADADAYCFFDRIKMFFERKGARLIIFPEGNQILFNQFIFACAPGHPVMKIAVDKITKKVLKHGGVDLTRYNAVIKATGPEVWTNAIYAYFKSVDIPIHRSPAAYRGYERHGVYVVPKSPELTFPQFCSGGWPDGWMTHVEAAVGDKKLHL